MKKKNKILITGHSGFIGSWLYYYLKKKNFDVYGISLKPNSKSNLFYNLKINSEKNSTILNILNYKLLDKYIKKIKPNIIIHLAAESLVLKSMNSPNLTYNTNINGTLNILNIIKNYNFISTGIFFTTDKVYENNDKKKEFIETDPLGGDDPYSGSKSASEMVINSFTKSYLEKKKIIILRCGNIIGGGDNGKNRIIPDIIKSITKKKTLKIRNPKSTRPWQNILDVVYILYFLVKQTQNKKSFFQIFNISSNNKPITVEKIVMEFKKKFNFKFKLIKKKNFEKKFLNLNSDKISKYYKLKNYFNSKTAVFEVIEFYQELLIYNKNFKEIIDNQIKNYERHSKNI